MVEKQSEGSCVEIDGSLYEGGGQMFRTSLALSNILKIAFRIQNIRKNRPNPGINNQLLSAIRAMKAITNPQMTGDKTSSQILYYAPEDLKAGDFLADCHTAGSTTLMFQSLLPTLLFAPGPSTLRLKGGTNVNKSPPSLAIQNFLRPYAAKMGIEFEYKVTREGYYPGGGGAVECSIKPIAAPIKPIELIQKNPIERIEILVLNSGEKLNAKDSLKPFKKDLTSLLQATYSGNNDVSADKIEIEMELETLPKSGGKIKNIYGIVFHAIGKDTFYDCSVFADKDEKFEALSDACYKKFASCLQQNTCLDEHSQDQLLLFMALAKGKSLVRIGRSITEHTHGSLYVLKSFMPDLTVNIKEEKDESGKSILIEMEGIGWFPK